MTTMTESVYGDSSQVRGRPRPAETRRRDETILALLRDNPGGLMRNDIAEMMGLNKSKTYLSLDRLRKQGLAEKTSPETSQADKDTLWVATGES
ncbi:helix-turn-helix domain-containing protein [Streptomyces sp. S1D4-14]|uniref:helix-turn-helix domain-containing protein n=1 Tax=Streptomyces sp. S1D4-14 TaxID=2594461 RepID=UPI001162660F|nr:helix-turn-helix domain-containing protein [Streptomyces sp. S1D4-14]QDN64387.1 ArsR family transcriptional regulator [Streptomyces sp. S1D4-14]